MLLATVQCHKLSVMATVSQKMDTAKEDVKSGVGIAKEEVQERLLAVKSEVEDSIGTADEDVQFSSLARSEFMQHALRDEETGELYMDEEAFVNAVAPLGHDYVCQPSRIP